MVKEKLHWQWEGIRNHYLALDDKWMYFVCEDLGSTEKLKWVLSKRPKRITKSMSKTYLGRYETPQEAMKEAEEFRD